MKETLVFKKGKHQKTINQLIQSKIKIIKNVRIEKSNNKSQLKKKPYNYLIFFMKI